MAVILADCPGAMGELGHSTDVQPHEGFTEVSCRGAEPLLVSSKEAVRGC